MCCACGLGLPRGVDWGVCWQLHSGIRPAFLCEKCRRCERGWQLGTRVPGWHERPSAVGIGSGVPTWAARTTATWPNASLVAPPLGSLPRCLLLSGCSLGFRLFRCLVAPAPGALGKRGTREPVPRGVGAVSSPHPSL